MRNMCIATLAALFICGCNTAEYHHEAGGPYYFKGAMTYQGIRPNDEITSLEADDLAKQGYAYYISHFDSSGKPIQVFRVYQGLTSLYAEMDDNGNIVLRRETVDDGNAGGDDGERAPQQ